MSRYMVHPNIVPLLGVMVDPLEFISAWMPGGDLMAYISKQPEADRHSLVRPPLLLVLSGADPFGSCLMWLKASGTSIPAT